MFPGHSVIGLRGWDDLLLRDPSGSTFAVPAVPLMPRYAEPCRVPDATLLQPDERFVGTVMWHPTPPVFGGDAQAAENVTWVSHERHREFVVEWNQRSRELLPGGADPRKPSAGQALMPGASGSSSPQGERMRTACAILAVVGAVLMLVAACFALLLFLYAEGESSAGELEPRPWTTWYTAIVLAIVVAGIVPFVLTAIVWQRPRLYAQLALWYVALGAVAPIGLFAVMSVVAVASDSNVPTIADGLHVTVRWLPAWLALTLPLSIAGTMAKRIP